MSSLDSTVRLFDKANGGLLNTFTGHKSANYRIPSVLNNTEEHVISGSEDGRLLVWDVVSAKVAAEVEAHSGKVISGVACHPMGGHLATCGGDGDITLWSV